MSDSSSADFLGRYVLFMVLCSEQPPVVGGWFTVGTGGSLAFADQLLPFDNSAFFDFFYAGWSSSGSSVFIQSVATGQYLAVQGSDQALFASAATTAQAGQFYIGDGNWGVSEFSTTLSQVTANPFESPVACGSTVPDSPLGFVLNPAPDVATTIGMLCVTPGTAALSRRALPSDLAARLANVAPRPRSNATSRANLPALMEPRNRPPAMRAADGTPPLPYFAGKYSFGFASGVSGGWVAPTAGDTLPISQTLPTDDSVLCNLYMQPSINVDLYGELPAVSVQTTQGFLRMPTGSLLGPLGLDANVKNVASAAAFALYPGLGNFGALMFWPNPGGPIITVTGNANNIVCTAEMGFQSDGALLTRMVPGLQDILAPGAKNWWDGADLSYVDMRTCVGSLTGLAAQWGNANFTAAVLTKMDLTAVTIGNAVNFTNAVLAGAKFKSGQDLSRATLSGADLSGADLAGVDLSGATCVGTDFTDTDLRTTKLPTATGLLGQGSTGAIFAGATVPIASLGSDWRNLDLSATKLLPLSLLLPLPLSPPVTVTALRADNAKFQETILDGLTLAADANGHAASFQSADLTNASLQGVAAESANFSSAVLYAANLTNADLTSTVWSNAFAGSKQLLFTLSPFVASDLATLNNGSVPADLNSAFAANGHALQKPQIKVRSDSSAWLITDGNNVYSVIRAVNALDVLTTGRTSAQFSDATLANADLTGGSFAGVHFEGVQLTGTANASGVDFEQADFGNANISSTTPNQPNLQGAYLYGAKLDGAFMFYANLAGASLSPSTASAPATMYGAMLAGATLTGANLDGTVMTGAFIGLQPQGAPGESYSYVPLFTLDAATFTPILNNGAHWGTSAPAELQTQFSKNNISLSGPAFFTAYPGQALWGISLTNANLDAPPTPATAGWVWTTFTIMQGTQKYQGTSDLIVYGTMFWMFAPDTTGALQAEPYSVAQTTISQSDLTPNTYCPNSRIWATNQVNGVPWEAAMMPASTTTLQSK